jgi:hypothetical protein
MFMYDWSVPLMDPPDGYPGQLAYPIDVSHLNFNISFCCWWSQTSKLTLEIHCAPEKKPGVLKV